MGFRGRKEVEEQVQGKGRNLVGDFDFEVPEALRSISRPLDVVGAVPGMQKKAAALGTEAMR